MWKVFAQSDFWVTLGDFMETKQNQTKNKTKKQKKKKKKKHEFGKINL